jgi:hypothetical protein
MGATYPGTTPTTPTNPNPSASPPANDCAPSESSCSCPDQSNDCSAQHAAIIDLGIGTHNGLTVDLDVLGSDVANIDVGSVDGLLGGTDGLLGGTGGVLCVVDGLLDNLLT